LRSSIALALCLVVLALPVPILWHFGISSGSCIDLEVALPASIVIVMMMTATCCYFVISTQMRWWSTCAYLVLTRWHIYLNFLNCLLFLLLTLDAPWCEQSFYGSLHIHEAVLTWLSAASLIFLWCNKLIGFLVLKNQLWALEVQLDQPLGSWVMNALLKLFAASIVATSAVFLCAICLYRSDYQKLFWIATGVLTLVISLSTLLVMVLMARGFSLALIYSRREALECCGSQHVLVERAMSFSKKLLVESVLTLSLVALSFASQSLWFFANADDENPGMDAGYPCLAAILFSSASLANCSRFGAALCGISTSNMTKGSSCREKRDATKVAEDWKTGHEAWDAKTHELASRGITLQALLKFYGQLGSKKMMPNFNAAEHRTADIVREAIIPMSRGTKYGDCAAAIVMMNGKTVIPQRMVTHAWSNNFTHLVASVLANALQVPDYHHLVGRLQSPEELRALQAELRWKGLLNLSFWICAFSVNQHAGICGGMSCPCSHEKFLSDTPPLYGNQSINCEMNKFIDMMSCLSCISPRFEHFIATDMDFYLFSRAWCVAEIHCGRRLRLTQNMAMHSQLSLKNNKAKLKDLKVQEMKASNPDDVTFILSHISDVHAFNKDVQELIFAQDGLVQTWCNGLEQMHLLGKVARRGSARSTSS